MCDVGFGRRMVFGSEERREQMRKREKRREIMRERRKKFRGIKKVLLVHTMQLQQYHHIFTMVL